MPRHACRRRGALWGWTRRSGGGHQALGEETSVEIESARLEGDRAAARELLNALLARPASGLKSDGAPIGGT
jgi:hypothetical protein